MAKRTAVPKVTITWYGHSAFLLESPDSVSVLIDPWLENPRAPVGAVDAVSPGVMLITHGHGDHIGNAPQIAKRTGVGVVAIHEVSLYLKSLGVPTAVGMNKGGTLSLNGVQVTMVDAKHSSAIDAGPALMPGGEAAGYVVRFANGFTVYHAGDTAVFGDMKLIAQLYKPDVALLPIGDLYTMGPREAALAVKLIKPRFTIGMHYGTFPPLTGTPEAVKKLLPHALRLGVRELVPGVPLALR